MIKLKFLAPLDDASRARTAFGRRVSSGSLGCEGGWETIQEQTLGSRIASRHRSAAGKRDSTGRLAAIAFVACDQASRLATFAEGTLPFAFAVPVRVKRGFKYVVTTSDIVLFTWSFE